MNVATMPRRPRVNFSDLPLHLIQRGNNRQACFFAEEDYRFYLHWLRLGAEKYGCAVHAYVLMTNHVHLLLTPRTTGAASRLMQSLGRRYVQYVNRSYGRSGTLWEGRFKASLVSAEDYLLKCCRYVELNPVRAGIVRHPDEYVWSSHGANGLGERSELVTPHELYLRLGRAREQRLAAYRSLFRTELDDEDLGAIRKSVNQGLPLGAERFRLEVEVALGRKLAADARGRPRKGSGGYAGEQGKLDF